MSDTLEIVGRVLSADNDSSKKFTEFKSSELEDLARNLTNIPVRLEHKYPLKNAVVSKAWVKDDSVYARMTVRNTDSKLDSRFALEGLRNGLYRDFSLSHKASAKWDSENAEFQVHNKIPIEVSLTTKGGRNNSQINRFGLLPIMENTSEQQQQPMQAESNGIETTEINSSGMNNSVNELKRDRDTVEKDDENKVEEEKVTKPRTAKEKAGDEFQELLDSVKDKSPKVVGKLTGLLKVMLEQKESIGKLASEKDKLIKKIKDQNVSRYKKLIDTLQKSMDGIKGSNDSGMIKENDSRFNNVKSSLENCGSEMNNIPYNTMEDAIKLTACASRLALDKAREYENRYNDIEKSARIKQNASQLNEAKNAYQEFRTFDSKFSNEKVEAPSYHSKPKSASYSNTERVQRVSPFLETGSSRSGMVNMDNQMFQDILKNNKISYQ